jgi:hypothetical protein
MEITDMTKKFRRHGQEYTQHYTTYLKQDENGSYSTVIIIYMFPIYNRGAGIAQSV